jgi:hypothetical protein
MKNMGQGANTDELGLAASRDIAALIEDILR